MPPSVLNPVLPQVHVRIRPEARLSIKTDFREHHAARKPILHRAIRLAFGLAGPDSNRGNLVIHWGMGLFKRTRPPEELQPTKPTFSSPNASETDWMVSHLAFAAECDVGVDDPRQIGKFYEMLLDSWRSSPEGSRSDPNTSINMLGTAFGEYLVRHTPLRWVIASDARSTELAVHDDRTDFLIYPANVVAKRWVKQETGAFIPAMASEIQVRLRTP